MTDDGILLERYSDLGGRETAYLSHCVGAVAMNDRRGSWAVGGVGSHNLGGVDGIISPGIGSRDESEASSSDGEAHFDDQISLIEFVVEFKI